MRFELIFLFLQNNTLTFMLPNLYVTTYLKNFFKKKASKGFEPLFLVPHTNVLTIKLREYIG